jgi:hypothetical protein
MRCPICKLDVPRDSTVCPTCRRPVGAYPTLESIVQTGPFIALEGETPPWTLWILPVLLGLVGGSIAAVIAAQKYHAPWTRYVALGIITTFIVYYLWIIL